MKPKPILTFRLDHFDEAGQRQQFLGEKTNPPSEHRLSDAERPGNAGIGGTDTSRFTQSETVAIGSTVRLEKSGSNGGRMEVTIVEDGHDVERGLIGKHTPLGRALLDAEVGETIEYRVGAYLHEVKILSIK